MLKMIIYFTFIFAVISTTKGEDEFGLGLGGGLGGLMGGKAGGMLGHDVDLKADYEMKDGFDGFFGPGFGGGGGGGMKGNIHLKTGFGAKGGAAADGKAFAGLGHAAHGKFDYGGHDNGPAAGYDAGFVDGYHAMVRQRGPMIPSSLGRFRGLRRTNGYPLYGRPLSSRSFRYAPQFTSFSPYHFNTFNHHHRDHHHHSSPYSPVQFDDDY